MAVAVGMGVVAVSSAIAPLPPPSPPPMEDEVTVKVEVSVADGGPTVVVDMNESVDDEVAPFELEPRSMVRNRPPPLKGTVEP